MAPYPDEEISEDLE
ncbi:unnamed protein product, partial [Allacma fusca]